MDSIIVKGGRQLVGEIKISGAKNAALPIMAAALLTEEELTLTNVPKLTDIFTMKSLLENHGAAVELTDHGDQLKLSIKCTNIDNHTAPYDIVRKMRASIWVLGPLVARFGQAVVSFPGGCALGARQVDMHLSVLEAMGAEITVAQGYITARTKTRLKGTHFSFYKSSVGATINAVMAASLAEGETILFNSAIEPEIVDLCHCLNKMGAEITGTGTSELRINGKTSLQGVNYEIMPDRIEAGTYMIAAAITKGDLYISNINYSIIENLGLVLSQIGIQVTPLLNKTERTPLIKKNELKLEALSPNVPREYNQEVQNSSVTSVNNTIRVKYIGNLKPLNIQTQPYPGFSTDLQAQFMSLMTICDGVSVITENIFENRFMHVPELCRMGANIIINDSSAIVRGVEFLTGAEVMASDLRASVSLVLAGLVARGETRIRRVYHLDRGYQMLEQKLTNCGARIFRIPGDTL